MFNRLRDFLLLATCLAAVLLSRSSLAADPAPFTGEKSQWHDDFDRYDFILDEATLEIQPFARPAGEKFNMADPPAGKRRCLVIAPKKPAAGNPWSWQACYWDHEPQTEVELLRRGYHIAYISANAKLKPDQTWDAWYTFLTDKHGLSAKPAFVGMSRGGEYAYTWATANPQKVSCIYADNPAIHPDALKKLGDLAAADVPLLHVCGSIDPLLGRCSNAIENIYRQYGGRISVMIQDGVGHHPHSLRDPTPIADFIEQQSLVVPATPPAYLSGRTTRTSLNSAASDYRYFPKEKKYITCRGPWFVPGFDRYAFELPGVEGAINIIVPQQPAPGNPWVYRADLVDATSAVDLALLGKGFHIVTGPVPYNADGPSQSAWNKVYEHLGQHQFAKQPVLAGVGGAAGEAYAWAIANPEKVSCIYAENPLLRCTMSKAQPLEGLGALAKAGVPILHVCGSLDPHLESQTRVAEKAYKELNGSLQVIVQEGVGHYPTAPHDLATVSKFIVSKHSAAVDSK